MEDIREIIIIGSGPAGLTAAIYNGRAGLKPLVIAGYQPGGQLMNTTTVENYPGFPEGIEGPKLMMNFIEQAKRFGAEMVNEDATYVDFSGDVKIVKTSKGEYKARAVIIATGALPRRLDIPGEDKFYGRGVSTCATCDGALFKDKVVAVVGGGDSAVEEATFLTRHVAKVYMIHRRDELRASKIMADRALNNDKIEMVWDTEVKEVIGEDGVVAKLKVFNNKTNEESELKVDGLFLAIGHIPVTGFLEQKVSLKAEDYVQVEDHVKTNIEGVFAAGDVEDNKYRQAITAAGLGCMAALEAEKWLDAQDGGK